MSSKLDEITQRLMDRTNLTALPILYGESLANEYANDMIYLIARCRKLERTAKGARNLVAVLDGKSVEHGNPEFWKGYLDMAFIDLDRE